MGGGEEEGEETHTNTMEEDRYPSRDRWNGKIDIENPGHATNKEKIERYDPYGTLWDGGGGGFQSSV